MRRALRLIFGRAQIAHAVDDEIAFHLEMRIQRLMAAGMSPERARREALRQFGDLETVKHDCVSLDEERERAMQRANMLDELRQDVAYAFRTLRRNAGFSVVIVATLALGIGANTAIFTLIDAVLLRSLPVPGAHRLVAVGDPARTSSLSQGGSRFDLLSHPLYRALRARATVFDGVLASGRTERLDVRVDREGGSAEHPRGRLVSGNYFSVLGVPAAFGRSFSAEEEGEGAAAEPAVVISHDYWQRRFAGDRAIVGRKLTINGVPATIIGVGPEGFTGEIVGASTEIWMPLSMQPLLTPHRRYLDDWSTSWLLALGRLAPGTTLEQARSSIAPILRQVIEDNAGGFKDQQLASVLAAARTDSVFVSDGAKGFSRVRRTFRAPLMTLMVGVALLLLIVCANVANLLLARAIARAREIGVRLALGAGRGRLVRQLLTESFVLGAAGAAGGLLVAWWGSRLLITLAADGASAIPLETRLDLPVLGFTLALTLAAVAVFGLVPALRASRVDLATTMRAHARAVGGAGGVNWGVRGQRIPVGRLLIAAQVALSLVLLVGAGLLVRSLRSLQQGEVGLDRDHLLIVDVDVGARGYAGARRSALVRTLAERFERIPGVLAASYSENGIFSGTESQTTLSVQGFTARHEKDSLVYSDQVGPGYARTIGARVLQGRDFRPDDDDRGPRVAMLNERAARFYFPDAAAVGKWIRVDSTTMEIVGVIGDVKDHDLRTDVGRRIYLPYLAPQGEPGSAVFEIRTTGDPARIAPAVRSEITAVDATLSIDGIDPLARLMRQSLREERLVARLAAGFGVGALLLAALGLYGVMTYAINRRTGEIGLRVALGAQRGTVIRLVLFDALRIVVVGFVVGLPLALASVRLLDSQLHGVAPSDPVAIAAAVLVLTVSAVAAVLMPALRASRVAPIVALREE